MNARMFLALAALLLAGPALSQTKGQIRLPEMAGLAEKASESVSVTLDSNLLGLACRFLNSGDPEQAAARDVCSALTGIYVRKFTFDSDYAYPKADIDGIRRQLASPGWSQIVGARSRKEQTDVNVYVLTEGGKARGLAIIASEPREFAIVNIVGNVDLEQLHELNRFGVPDLEIDTPGKATSPARPETRPAAKPPAK
ncbi:MAG TPA: DUF4252 domain-containing protein [Steroidobacteraceae bacterium]|nr:DUF4252 domain-containing protein [Steroidobacteraceae bacterium]